MNSGDRETLDRSSSRSFCGCTYLVLTLYILVPIEYLIYKYTSTITRALHRPTSQLKLQLLFPTELHPETFVFARRCGCSFPSKFPSTINQQCCLQSPVLLGQLIQLLLPPVHDLQTICQLLHQILGPLCHFGPNISCEAAMQNEMICCLLLRITELAHQVATPLSCHKFIRRLELALN